MNNKLREDIQDLANEALHVMRGYLMGDDTKEKRVVAAMRGLGFGVSIEKMNQMKEKDEKSITLRYLNLKPDDKKEYIRITAPKSPPLLLAKPNIKRG